jgi:hypothetical protein
VIGNGRAPGRLAQKRYELVAEFERVDDRGYLFV